MYWDNKDIFSIILTKQVILYVWLAHEKRDCILIMSILQK